MTERVQVRAWNSSKASVFLFSFQLIKNGGAYELNRRHLNVWTSGMMNADDTTHNKIYVSLSAHIYYAPNLFSSGKI